MKEENEAILLAMIIGAVILGIGLAMFLNRPFTGYGAVVIAIGLMTLSLILTMRAEEIIHLRIYPTATRSKTVPEISVETMSPTEIQGIEERQPVQEAPEMREYFETQEPPQEIETQQVEETQEPWQTGETSEEETEQYYSPSMYEPAQEEEHKPEVEHESESSIEASPPS